MWVSLRNVTKRFKISPANLDLYSQNYIITCIEGKHQPWHTNTPENHSRSPPPALLLKSVPSLTNSVTKPLESETLTKKESPCLQENVDIHINILWHALPKKLEFKKIVHIICCLLRNWLCSTQIQTSGPTAHH